MALPTRCRAAALPRLRPLVVVLVVLAWTASAFASESERPVLRGFTAFPYDLSVESIEKVHQTIVPNSTLYAVHLGPGNSEECLPWDELWRIARPPRTSGGSGKRDPASDPRESRGVHCDHARLAGNFRTAWPVLRSERAQGDDGRTVAGPASTTPM